ncbi:polar amino acid transport system substrate-binding protein [Peribacillus deserti]|uniref:Polar amino acid transport system substrate-binding protein n=1 Tax=Peribacillus deserti TaxID=673318 RepID=A0ABS2QJ86_9BACI|nr:transporter substrate-binding domain-containing protein [Peribacillus deserti]MBM7693226.1 polar amino acid transport system substrate-binding protein [Peribacillus deserti]
MKKWLSVVFAAVLLMGLLSACGTSEKTNGGKEEGEDTKVLKMGTSADYRPFEYIDTAKGDEIIGFDVDIAKAITKNLGYKMEIQDMEFNGLVTALQNKQIDFVLAGMTPNEERKKSVDFSDIYYSAKHLIVTKKDSGIKSKQDLNGKTVGVQLGSIQEGIAADLKKKEKIELKADSRNKIPELIQEISAGRLDAAIIEDTVAKGYLEDNKDLVSYEIPVEGEAGSAIAFQKDSKLTKEFNAELNKMKENGELEKLIIKWFGSDAK